EDRRRIERNLFAGQLLGVTATCALELGVDVGNLDVTLHMGFPGAVSSLWQQAGRAGRAGRDGIAILVCFDTPIDQYFALQPSLLLDRPPERAVLDAFNVHALRGQILCAADESVVGGRHYPGNLDRALFGAESFDDALSDLLQAEQVTGPLSDGAYRKLSYVVHPQRQVNLRMIDPVTFEVVDVSRAPSDGGGGKGSVIDSVGYTRAFYELFEGAIYMHQAKQYLITKLDLLNHKAYARPVRVGYHTSAQNHTEVNLLKKLESSPDGGFSTGCAQVVTRVWGYRKIWLRSNKIFETGLFSLPPLEYETRALFIDIDGEMKEEVERQGFDYLGGLHGINHALLAVTPLFLKCDPGDIETEHVQVQNQRPRPPRVCVYDKRPGGVGASEGLFNALPLVLSQAHSLLSSCPCSSPPSGCPSCLSLPSCSSHNIHLHKPAALLLLQLLLDKCATQISGSGKEGGGEGGEEGEGGGLTPRKEARQRALRQAKGMEEARVRDLAVQKAWVKSFPNYRPEID
ncbi:hypothetical protein VYU27_008780, partial [Nannochloropsis oceanica]